MKILTCNLRGYGEGDGENAWKYRKGVCVDVIRAENADIICFQEMMQISDMRASFPDYGAYGMFHEAHERYPRNCIFPPAGRFRLLTSAEYWLSETPHLPGSKSWDSECIRLANWVMLQDMGDGTEFRVINTHLDHVSQGTREKQAALIAGDASAYRNDYPQVPAGDTNCASGNLAIDIFKAGGWRDSYAAVHLTENPGHTHHAFMGPDYDSPSGKIDWIFFAVR